ncbi:hypothetical protein NE237_001431 [Protea cynaroides]|uniref:CCHC-type domain-containing protein n=1 Tax=Protea cynaroides TaxID=273540 RepID=A0A9Q0KTA6_9MAGN|nr:hypothetical protein NE237_001431 [Protea cynaroides]
MPPRRELRISNPAPHPSSLDLGQEELAAQREEVQGSNVPPAPQMSKPIIFKGIASDPVQAMEWISEMEDIFEDVGETFQLSTYGEVLEKAQIIEFDKRKEGAATRKFLGKKSMQSERNVSNKKSKKSFDICYDKPQSPKSQKRHLGECGMGLGVCYHCREKGHMARECTTAPKSNAEQQRQ